MRQKPALTLFRKWETIPSMRFLLSRTDALGDLIVSLPVMERILSRDPSAEVHWLVRPYAAPLLVGLPGVAGVHIREAETDLSAMMRQLAPDAVLNLNHRDKAILPAAKAAGVPIRVGRARGLAAILATTHVLWKGRRKSARHESENALDFLSPWHWDGGWPSPPRLEVTEACRLQGETDLAALPRPRLAIATRSSGSSAYPSSAWWECALPVLREAGWNPVIVSPPEDSSLSSTDLHGLLGRLAACDAFLGPSTGPTQIAAVLGLPVLALMGQTINRGPSRWAPMGTRVQVLQYPGAEADLSGGMDRLDPKDLLLHLERLK